MVIAVMYPPCSQARGIHAVSQERIVGEISSSSDTKVDKEAVKAAKKAQKEKRMREENNL